jgi:DNA primase
MSSSDVKQNKGIFPYSEIAGLPFTFTSRGEMRMKCPFCLIMGRKKPDTHGKFYYNRRLGKGHCFRCEAKVFREKNYNLGESADFYMALEELDDNVQFDKQLFDISWSRPVMEVPEAVKYLKGRGFSEEDFERFNLRYTNSPERGIVLPSNFDNGKTRFFQIRLLQPDPNGPKMSSPTDCVKPLYGVEYFKPSPSGHWNLCEGVFSTIASGKLNENEVVGSYGKSLTDFQIEYFRTRSPKSVHIMYDGGEVRAPILSAKKLAPYVGEIFFVLFPFGQDPNDVMLKGLGYKSILVNSYNLAKIKGFSSWMGRRISA